MTITVLDLGLLLLRAGASADGTNTDIVLTR